MEEIRSSETPDLTRATRRHIPEDNILLSHRLGFVAEKKYVSYEVRN
jgi:hypothetical protein